MFRQALRLLIAIAIIFSPCISQAHEDSRFAPFALSLPPFSLKPNELVISFNCKTNGAILRVSTPYLWKIKIENGDQGVARLTADVYVGDFAFANCELSYFNNFLIVGKIKNKQETSFSSVPFYITIELSIGTQDNFDNPKILKFTTSQLILKPVKPEFSIDE